MKKGIILILAVLMSLMTFFGCAKKADQTDKTGTTAEEEEENKKEKTENEKDKVEKEDMGKTIKVVTTLFPDYSLAKEIAPKADVSLILPPGVESHTFEPTPKDMKELESADLVVYTGDYMEMWFQKVRESLNLADDKIVDVSAGLELVKPDAHDHHHHDEDMDEDHDHDEDDDHEDMDEDHDHDEDDDREDMDEDHDHDEHAHEGHEHHHEFDPHIWVSPKRALVMAENIYNGLVKVDDKNKEEYAKNYNELKDKLMALDSEYEKVISEAENQEVFFASKAPLKYVELDYGLHVHSIYKNLISGSEASAKAVAEMSDELKEENAKVLFFIEEGDPTIAYELAKTAGIKAELYHTCHNVSKEEYDAGETYLSLMNGNVEKLKEALN